MACTALPRAALRAAAALLVLACVLGRAHAAMPGAEGSVNMTDPCYSNPAADSCANFQRTAADWTDDMTKLCKAMPYMIGCDMYDQCQNGKAKADSPYCSLPSLVGDICKADSMSRMSGCEAYNALCADGTKVQQCLSPGIAPNVLTTFGTKADIDGICTSHSMDGCQQCSSIGTTNFRDCADPLVVIAKLCISMPGMPQCASWHKMCESTPELADGFPLVCTGDAADGSESAPPPMKMWFHQSTREMFLFKEWVPNNTGQYVGLCIAMCALAVFTQFLKAVRLRVEMRWTAQQRKKCCCDPMDDSSDDLEAAAGGHAGAHARPPSASSSGLGLDKQANGMNGMHGMNGHMATAAAAAAVPKPCCGGATSSAVVPAEPEPVVPTSKRVPSWRRPAGLTLCGHQLMTKDQFYRNFWRAVFTFVVIFLDYSLMLVVMTFNIGIILAVCGGFAIGALLFGHAGERASTPLSASQPGGNGPLARGSSAELEATFVEGPACCSGGSGCGGGGHSGGQL